MNPKRDALSEALHELAAGAPEASPALQARLGEAFRHHHARRRLKQRVAVVAAIVACVAISGYWLRPHGQVAKKTVAAPASQTTQNPTLAAPTTQAPAPEQRVETAKGLKAQRAPVVAKSGVKPRRGRQTLDEVPNRRDETPPTAVESADFVALPTFDPAIPLGESRMVRMDLTGSALQLIGYPVDGQLLDRRIVTDVLVGQDGMPYAVRLVHARNVH